MKKTLSPVPCLVLLLSGALSATSVFAKAPGATTAASAGWFVDPTIPTDVQAAHDAFLQGDYGRMAVAIKRALINHPGDGDIRRDLLELYDQTYELKGDHAVPPDWSLPQGMSFALVTFKKRYAEATGRIDYRVSAYAETDPAAEIEQLQIIHYPGEVLVDKLAGKGYQESGTADGKATFFTCQDYQTLPSAEGLYLLNLKLKGQPMTEGWFLMSGMNAKESPNVTVPSLNEVLTTATPTFQWENFVSSQYRNFETRKGMAVVYVTPRTSTDVWANFNLPAESSVTVGASGPGEEGNPAINPGSYSIEIGGKERYHFGALMISRDSGTVVPFSIK